MLVASMTSCGTFIKFCAIELVDPVIAGKTLAGVGANDVDALCIGVAMMPLGSTLLFALVHV